MANYEQLLMDAGWDDVDYLDFTDSDLISAGIHSEAHRQIVSNCSIKSFSKCCH